MNKQLALTLLFGTSNLKKKKISAVQQLCPYGLFYKREKKSKIRFSPMLISQRWAFKVILFIYCLTSVRYIITAAALWGRVVNSDCKPIQRVTVAFIWMSWNQHAFICAYPAARPVVLHRRANSKVLRHIRNVFGVSDGLWRPVPGRADSLPCCERKTNA